MSSLTNIQLSTTYSSAQLQDQIKFGNGKHNFADTFINFLSGNAGGLFNATYTSNVGALEAAGKIIIAGAPTALDTFTIGNIIFTAETSGAIGNQFNIGTSVTATATNIKNAVNASTTASKFITATSTAGTVTFTSNTAGAIGNGIQLSSALTNGTAGLVAFTGGTNGTSFVAAF